ncbi:MAG: putative hydro-lyase [Desulfarculaceae bacterium]|nr:putative hydro-lyase [Desulfarculaceae bacterium]
MSPQPDPAHHDPRAVRGAIARQEINGNTAQLCPGYAQANLVILPKDWAFEFLLFGLRNRQACPILEVLDPGNPFTREMAEGADLRESLPRYRLWKDGELVEEPTDIKHLWRDDLVSFLLGCSFSFDDALKAAGLPVRHQEMGRNVPMYRTSLPAAPAGRLGGPLVVSMRPMHPDMVEDARRVSGAFGEAHGEPVHFGDPAEIGIVNIESPDYGDAVTINPGEVPVFWACGVTPQAAVAASKVDLAITHAPGHMFITDLKAEKLAQRSLVSCAA